MWFLATILGVRNECSRPRKVETSLPCGTSPGGIRAIENLPSLHAVLCCAADVVVFLCALWQVLPNKLKTEEETLAVFFEFTRQGVNKSLPWRTEVTPVQQTHLWDTQGNSFIHSFS